MGEEVRTFRKEATKRWKNKMPKFFRVVMIFCAFVSGLALAVNTAMMAAGAQPHEWWVDIFPYLIGIPAGMAFTAKFTQSYGSDGKPIDYNDYRKQEREGKTILEKDDF